MKSKHTSALLFLAAISAAAQEPASIQGRTLDALTGQPLRRVHIRLVSPRPDIFEGGPSWGALSDNQGHFSIASIPPGRYLVQAMLPGYFYIPKTTGALALTVKTGDRIDDLRLDLSPRAILSGRVLTADGAPVEDAMITREPASEDDEALFLALQTSGSPWSKPRDANGGFRFVVPPGKYRLRVQRGSIAVIGPDGIMTQHTYGDTYYPDVADEKSAGTVAAVAGRETSGLDIRVGAAKPLSIAGTVAGIPSGGHAEVMVICSNCGDRPSHPVRPDGSFLAADLTPDTYYVWALCGAGTEALRSPTVKLVVRAAPTVGITLQLYPRAKISGTVQLAPGLTASPGASRVVRLQPVEGGFLQRRERALSGSVNQAGSFSIDAVEPDLYRLIVVPMPDDGYLQSALPDAPLREWAATYRFSTDGPVSDIMASLDLRRGATGTQLRIVIAPGASISGKLTGADSEVNDGSGELLLAPEGKTDPDEMLRARISPQGEYAFRGLPPGTYRLIGFGMDDDSDAEQSLAKMLEKARRIDLKAGEHVVIDINLSKKRRQ
jgi:hypothetical protein